MYTLIVRRAISYIGCPYTHQSRVTVNARLDGKPFEWMELQDYRNLADHETHEAVVGDYVWSLLGGLEVTRCEGHAAGAPSIGSREVHYARRIWHANELNRKGYKYFFQETG